uniref:Uncharacterized protein n=1 Tax=Hucho hucho TaxID=62062 RepID=A0A4W5L7Y7_9TELE
MNMSRGSSLDRLSEEDSTSGGSHRVHRRRGDYRMESQDSMASLASRDSISSAYTEATMLFSRQDTLDELDGMPSDVPIPKTSERARPKLRKIYGLDASKSTDSSSSQVSRCLVQAEIFLFLLLLICHSLLLPPHSLLSCLI